MKIKWVCPVCSTTNICEKTEYLRCFVCGTYYDGGSFLSESHVVETAEISVTKRRFKDKISALLVRLKSLFGITRSAIPKREIIDWNIKHSPTDSKEAYVEAIPVYAEERDIRPPIAITIDTEIEDDSTEIIKEDEPTPLSRIPSFLSEDIEPWEEHGLKFDYSKLRDTGCVSVNKENIHGNKCYKLMYRNGSEKILTLAKMKIMGYLKEKTYEDSLHTSAADVGSFIPWAEHKIIFDTEKLKTTGCINVEQIEVGGNKCYKLTYRNGVERILNIFNLKMMGYVRDI